MSMYKWILVAVLCILTFAGGYMFADVQKNANLKALYQGDSEIQKELLLGNMSMTYAYSNYRFPDFPLMDRDGKEMFFSHLMEKEKKLVFRISSNNCSSCIDFTVGYLKSILNVIPRDKIVVIVEGNGKRELKAFADSLHLELPLYYIVGYAFQGFLDKENLPFFFMSSSELKVEDLFIPIKEIPEHTEFYFRAISKKYFL